VRIFKLNIFADRFKLWQGFPLESIRRERSL